MDYNKLLILTESSNIFQWKSAEKSKVGVAFGANLGQIRSNVVKKQRNWQYQKGFFQNY